MIDMDQKLPAFTKLVIEVQLKKGQARWNNIPRSWTEIPYLELVGEALGRIDDNNLESALCFLAMAAANKYNAEFRTKARVESLATTGFTLGLETFEEVLIFKATHYTSCYGIKTMNEEIAEDEAAVALVKDRKIREVMGEDWWNRQIKEEQEFFAILDQTNNAVVG